jgi:hypothetical protein
VKFMKHLKKGRKLWKFDISCSAVKYVNKFGLLQIEPLYLLLLAV